jgi:hypothetical protein
MQYTTGGSLSSFSGSKWTINGGGGETSDWACAALLHYGRELSLAEVQQVEEWLGDLFAITNVVPGGRARQAIKDRLSGGSIVHAGSSHRLRCSALASQRSRCHRCMYLAAAA